MSRTIASFVSLALLATPALAQRTLTPAEMEADLFQMSDELMTQHAGLYRYATPEQIDEAFGAALIAASQPMTDLEFFRTVSRLVSKVRCGHTRARPSRAIRQAALERRGVLPVEVLLSGERLFVVRSLDDTLPEGFEIVSIDGRSIADIRREAFSMLPSDGFNETGKQRQLQGQFAPYYALYVQDADDEGPYAVRLAGEDADVLVDGLAPEAFSAAAGAREPSPIIGLELRTEDDLAILSVSAFGDPATGPSFPEQLGAEFTKVRASGVGNLVLDLRGNGGGDDTYGALLVSYFSPEPFGYFDHIEVTADYEGEGGIVERGGLRLVTQHPGTQVQQPSEPGFRGESYVLIDGWTFSTAADVATVLHHNGLATFVGEETGGGYDGNTSGRTQRRDMRNSGIEFSCPLWMYTTANVGHAHAGRGVPPDHPTAPTVEDVRSGRDVELELVLGLIASK